MSFEDDLGWEYFGADPMTSPRMQEHMDWHMDPQNQHRTGNYGERFLLFHEAFVDKFDAFRMTKGLPSCQSVGSRDKDPCGTEPRSRPFRRPQH